jgi:hypothetical protein
VIEWDEYPLEVTKVKTRNLSLLQSVLCRPHALTIPHVIAPLFPTISTGQGRLCGTLENR